MANLQRFEVIQIRSVEVEAGNIDDAVRLASAAFQYGQNDDNTIKFPGKPIGMKGDSVTRVREKEMYITDKTPPGNVV